MTKRNKAENKGEKNTKITRTWKNDNSKIKQNMTKDVKSTTNEK